MKKIINPWRNHPGYNCFACCPDNPIGLHLGYWYFAVREELRGKGYGQRILTQLIEHYKGQTCVLDMESPTQVCENSDQRERRHAFYLRNGFRDTNVYRTYNDITMTIMMMGEGTFTMQDWDDITNELKQYWWPDDIKEE